MKWLIGAVITATIAYYILQSMEDSKCDRLGQPRPSSGKKVATFFFILLLCLIVFYWFAAGAPADGSENPLKVHGGAMPRPSIAHAPRMDKQLLETHMIKNIREDIHVGAAPF